MTNELPDTVDCLVVGSGAAAMTAALAAKAAGMQVAVVEKTDSYGGTTALSGGVMWVPNNRLIATQQDSDSTDQAMTYLQALVGNRVSAERLRAFADTAPVMLDFLVDNGYLEVDTFVGFPDYFAELPGGKGANRSVEPRVFDGGRLGRHLNALRARTRPAAVAGIVGTMAELRALAEIRANPTRFFKAWHVVPRSWWARITGRRLLANGNALVAWLRHALLEEQIPVFLNTAFEELIVRSDRIAGARVNCDGRVVDVHAGAVILGCGGFEHNESLRQQYQGAAATSAYSSGAPGNTGDGIDAGIRAGAATDLMDDAWWAPTVLLDDGKPQIVIFERGKPGCVIVDQQGRRYVNEAAPYNEVVKAMRDQYRARGGAVPSYLIFDQTYRDRYPFLSMLPGVTPQRYLDSGVLVRADSLDELAALTGIDAATLRATLTRFNEMAQEGRDLDFQRGEFAFDRFSGDPSVKPNCCLAPVASPPFYAVKLYPGDLGTKGGLLTNANGQVLRTDGTVINGLYAAGNASASVMGETYPGAGGTIGPAMTFGYIAGMHAGAALRS